MTCDRKYVVDGIAYRMQELHDRYYMYCSGVNEAGWELSEGGAAVARSKCKTDLAVLTLVNELLGHIQHDFVLSDEAVKGYLKLCEPYEKHRIYRRGKK
jgi:hypothetical protein